MNIKIAVCSELLPIESNKQTKPWDVKYSIGNGIAKELIHMTHGHEQWWEDCLREWGVPGGRKQRGKIQTTVIA